MSVVLNPYEEVPIEELLVDITYEMPDLPDDAAIHFLRRTAIKMATDGNLIRRKVYVTTQSCVENYRIDAPDCMRIIGIMDVKNVCGGCCSQVTRHFTMPTAPCRGGVNVWFEQPRTIYISGASTGWEFEVDLAVAPMYDACTLPAEFRDKYYEVLLMGVRSAALGIQGKVWTNTNLAASLGEAFTVGIRDAALDSLTNGMRGAIRVHKPRIL